jgi:hypothetical protein
MMPARVTVRYWFTATIATALFKRGLRNQMIQAVGPVGGRKGRNMVGLA